MPWNRGNAANRTCQADVINHAKSASRSRAVSSGNHAIDSERLQAAFVAASSAGNSHKPTARGIRHTCMDGPAGFVSLTATLQKSRPSDRERA